MKTNPEYAALAYQKAILYDTVAMLKRHYLSDDIGTVPMRILHSEDVLRADADVPQEAFQRFITTLEIQASETDLEMRRFEFVRKNDPDKHQPKEPPASKSRSVQPKKGGKGGKGSKPPDPPK